MLLGIGLTPIGGGCYGYYLPATNMSSLCQNDRLTQISHLFGTAGTLSNSWCPVVDTAASPVSSAGNAATLNVGSPTPPNHCRFRNADGGFDNDSDAHVQLLKSIQLPASERSACVDQYGRDQRESLLRLQFSAYPLAVFVPGR